MYYDYGNTSGWTVLFAVAIVMMVGYLVILIGFYVVMALALSSFFRKVGVEPWIGWGPYYRTWKWLEVGGQPGWIALLALIPYGSYVTLVFTSIGAHRTGIGDSPNRSGSRCFHLLASPVVPWPRVSADAGTR